MYRAAVELLTQAGHDINPFDRMRLSLAYARLGDEKTAMRELATATADKRWSQAGDSEVYMWLLARIQLSLDKKSAAIDTLRKLVAQKTHNDRPYGWFSSELRIAPSWDPLRDDPRFQALLEKLADAAPVAASAASSTQE